MQPSNMSEWTKRICTGASWRTITDPELTAVYAESQDKKRPTICVFRNVLCHEIMLSFVPYTIEEFRLLSFDHQILAHHVAYRKACSWEVQVAQHGPLPVVFLQH